MKKIFVIMLACCLILTGCASKDGGKTGLVYDSKEYTSLEEMNAAAETNIQALGADESDERYEVISRSITQYSFKLDEENWCVRGSKDTDNDISGLHYENIGFEKDIEATYYNDEVYMHRFFDGDTQYTISVSISEGADIATSYFDGISSQIQTNITGVQSGYDVDLKEDGDNVVYTVTMHNADGTATVMEIIYAFENDKMVSILNNNIFETEEAAKDYYDLLIANGSSADTLKLEGKVISSENNGNVEFYSDYTKASFIEMMQNSLAQ